MLWDDTQLSVWMFSRANVPGDINDGSPDPSGWGTPVARWTTQSCDIQNAFRNVQSMARPFCSFDRGIENSFISLCFS